MTPSSRANRRALDSVLGWQDGLISRPQAMGCGMTPEAVRHRIRDGGPWQRVLPGVYLTLTGTPTDQQKATAALLYAGTGSVLTGHAALHQLGISRAAPRLIEVLVPHTRRRQSTEFVIISRTRRMPVLFRAEGGLRYVLAPRAVADAARGAANLREARAIVAGAVQRGRCPPSLLIEELATGPVRGSRLLRITVAEVVGGIRSVAEAEFRDLIIAAGLPRPTFNKTIRRPDRTTIAIVDAWWPGSRVAAEVDSREWHLNPEDWERTMRRHNELERYGIQVLHFSPSQIRQEPHLVAATIAGALRLHQSP